jgi:hypothetical protein
MTKTNTSKTTGQGASKSPSYIAFQVRDREGKDSFWNRIGAAFAHADGQGFTLQLETIPLDGRITLRVPTEK